MRTDALRPMHRSVLQRQVSARGFRVRPIGMQTIAMTDEQRQCMESIALSIFTDMTNAGATFQQALASIYLSGLQHGACAPTDTPADKPVREVA